ncbi:hypothetical protein VBD025_10670 [Virgibacillus flavescens]|uniref:hypothetical protein n=1 Tax=Virgibacillus flavescens TaxID=1611422 RepID=UPI003D34F271
MKQPVRAFSIGLFTAGIIFLAIVLYFEKDQEESTMSKENMITDLEKNGMQVLTQDEYISLSVNDESKDKDNEESKEPEKEPEKEQESEVKTYTLTIEPGLASSSISSILEDNGIIESASEFNDYLEQNDYSQYVQIGEFELTSDMTMNQVAETITN